VSAALWDAIGDQLLGFGIAFAVSNSWLVHHRPVRRFSGLDYRTIVANPCDTWLRVHGHPRGAIVAIFNRRP
jgi:hypothetical protein